MRPKTIVAKKEYIPFGKEWEKEMMKLTKKELVDRIRKLSKEKE